MKLSFSTVGCPDWMLNEVIAAAKDFGYDGIELRGIGEDLFLPRAAVFGPKRLKTSLRELGESKLEVPCVATDASCVLSSARPDVADNIREYIDLAVLINGKTLRLLGEEWSEPGENVDENRVYENLTGIVPYAEEKKIRLLIETNGIYADSKRLKELVEKVGSPMVGVLWDVNHPYTYFGEDPAETAANIGKYVGHVHMKDSETADGKLVYKMLGYGNLPIAGFLRSLKTAGYGGYLSLEWVKRWNQELEDPGVVFPHYVRRMKKYLENI
jgi:sugar phosphate isomerase/epimerase